MAKNNKIEKKKSPMQNITINIPECYDDNIQKLIGMGLVSSRSEAIRTAIREYLQKEYSVNLELLEFFKDEKEG
ncbi:MAG: ribbon-helix-helix protein, CopG family [Candidatus Lokiarchaeota archaeon]|jgi:Arc/MetJ-type ribon-helix-helix transcriptional regulator|nr:ribbon-helix-helix protein, CopG family [Candidatus Lokiarchaeota archaeon]